VLAGKVVNEDNQALPGATVFLYPIEKGTITDDKGNFIIHNLNKGNYKIEISFIGYRSLTDSVEISGDKTYNAQLTENTLNLQEVVITDNYMEIRKKEESLNIEIVNDDYLKQNLGGSLMNSLERLPGVTAMDIGSGQSKPVIRGLGFNRVVVVENNIKHEAQQWGADHGLEIDQYAVDHVEIIKGPASLMYGSDAVGGIVNIRQNEIPAQNTIGGTVDVTAKSNNNLLGSSLSLFGRKKWLYADVRVTVIDYADYKVPTDSVDIYSYRVALYKNRLRNTAGNEYNYHATIGIITKDFQSVLFVSQANTRSGFFANAHGLEPRGVDTDLHDESDRDIQYPYQNSSHFKLSDKIFWIKDNIRIEADFGFQRNFRQEWSQYVSHGYMPPVFPDTLPFPSDLEKEFRKDFYSGSLIADYTISKNLSLSAGFSGDYQDNRIDGREFIIPAFQQHTFGGFVLAKYSFSGISVIRIGGRYDYGEIHTNSYYDWFPTPVIEGTDTTFEFLQRAIDIDRKFSNLSWSVGYNYNPAKWTLKANVGKSFRMPIAKELAANGVDYKNFSYPVGNPDLSPEVSWQADIGAEYNGKRFAAGISPFVNYFSNYLYLNPSDKHDTDHGAGNQIYYYTQSSVFRYGGELHAHYQIVRSLQVGVIGEYVYSKQLSGEKKGFTLPFSPPASAIINLKYQKKKIRFIENAYFSIDYRITVAQDNIVPPEETTGGYQVINLGLGSDIKMKNQKINVSLQVQNLFNSKYFNHTSYYRLINVPEPGRNFIMNISFPFSGKLKQK
jgi:iron complex outermembrane receptor protein